MNKPKIRTLQLMGGGKSGGAELFFVRLMQVLARRAGEVEVLPVVKQGSWAAERLTEMGIKHETARFGGWFDWQTGRLCRKLATDFKPHVCMSWMNRATRFIPLPDAAKGLAWTNVARLGGYYDLKYYRNRVEYLVGNTHDIIRYCVEKGWPEDKTRYLGNFPPRPEEGWSLRRGVMRQRFNIPSDATVLLVAARLHKVKGYDTALKALAALPKNVHLLGVGDGPERASLEALVNELGIKHRVHLPGWVNNVSDAAAAADIWLVPSRHEPLGNSVLDAWSHGLPLVATRSAGPLSLVNPSENGLLVPIDDVDALALAVERLLTDSSLRRYIESNGLRTLETLFSEDVIVNAYVDYYRSIASSCAAESSQKDGLSEQKLTVRKGRKNLRTPLVHVDDN